MFQRFIDIILSGIAILTLSPLLIPVILVLRFSGEREIFYGQDRIGFGGATFRVLKFATMKKNSPSLPGGTVTVKDDPRVLPFGKILRKTKINELPQLLNIFWGDMSFIGPRPLTRQTFSAYTNEVQQAIVTVKPGLSGIGSVIFRDEEALLDSTNDANKFYNNVIAPYKGQLECWFINHSSTRVYILLIFVTIFVVLFPRSKIIWVLFSDLPQPPAALSRITDP